MRRLFLISLAGLTLAAVLGVAVYAYRYMASPVPVRKLPVEFEIPRGARFRAAVEILERAGVQVGRFQFEALARALGRARDIKAGSYELTAPLQPLQLLDKLTRGNVTEAQIRFAEGWTFRQIRAALEGSSDLRHDTAGLDQAQILKKLAIPRKHAAGLFFPDTYFFDKGASDLSVLRRAHELMQRNLKQQWAQREPGLPYSSPYQALIMASIIEKETGRASDRPMVAGVLVNRLRAGMRLQADPTVIYGLGPSFDGDLTKQDLLEDNPYNTYTRTGLPPTPIDMPGLASLHAALHPAKTRDMYYVASGDGRSVFSRTLAGHDRAVAKYERNARSQ